jgi:hypothetical protein
MDEIEFAAQFRPPAAGSLTEVLAKAAVMPDVGELAEAAAAKAAADAATGQREQLLMANRAAGDPIGMVSRCQAQLAEERDRVRDLESQLETARGRLSRAAANLDHWSAEVDAIHTAVARRSDTDDLLAPAKAAHAEFAAATRAAFAAVQAGTPRPARRPFGNAVRSDQPVTCAMCIKYGATAEQSFLIHADPSPEPAPAVPSEDEREWLDSRETAERRTPGRRYAEISR